MYFQLISGVLKTTLINIYTANEMLDEKKYKLYIINQNADRDRMLG